MASEEEKYLGVYVAHRRLEQYLTHKLLIDKFYNKLARWKVNIFSFAGRLELIKSVLLSVPIYFMSIARLPNIKIKELTGIMRRFLWGKVGQNRYLSLIAWRKICVSIEDEGLGIREVDLFNKALLQKITWQVAANQNRIWIQIMQAKYFPKGGFWVGPRLGRHKPLMEDNTRTKTGNERSGSMGYRQRGSHHSHKPTMVRTMGDSENNNK